METYESYEENYISYTWNNTSTFWNDSVSDTHDAAYTALPLVGLLLSLGAIITNTVTLIGISKAETPMSSHLMLVTSLCTADLLIGMGHLAMEVMYEISISLCPHIVLFNFNFAIFLCSILNIVAMALDHYIAIVKTGHYDRCCSRIRSTILITSIWATTLSVAILGNLGAYIYKLNTDVHMFYCEVFGLALGQMIILIFPVVPMALGILGFTYIQIYRRIRASSVTNDLQGALKVKYRAAMNTVFVLVMFTVTWFPMLICWLMPARFHNDMLLVVSQYLALMPVVNAICNPVLYAFRLKKVKRSLREACCRSCDRERRDEFEIGTMLTTNAE